LRQFFARRGVTVNVSALTLILSNNAVQAAPSGLALTISAAAAVAETTLISAATATAAKTLVMTSLQKTILTATLIAVGVSTPLLIQRQANVRVREENQAFRQEMVRLKNLIAENERLSNLVSQARDPFALTKVPSPRLPAPKMSPSDVQARLTDEELQSTRRIAELLKEDQPRKLTPVQIMPYLEQNGRSAPSLLAAFRATGDQQLLREAMEKYPDHPQVNFASIFLKDASTEERRERLEKFKESAPDNALGNYLSALDHFKSGQVDQAVQELSAASSKSRFEDYTLDFGQENDEIWRLSGYPTAEAKIIGATSLELPHLAQLKQLAQETVSLANSYRQAGDETSAQIALQMGANLGRKFSEKPGELLISRLVGVALENIALRAMEPSSAYGNEGQTVQNRIDELTQLRAGVRERASQFDKAQPLMSTQDWISYIDRCRIFGEEAAVKWAIDKHVRQ
jgi:hypothetical protein